MSISNEFNFQEKKDNSNIYTWLVVAIFGCFILCIATAFCGLAVWAIRNNSNSTNETTPEVESTPQNNFLEEINSSSAWKVFIEDDFTDNKNKWDVGSYQNDDLTINRDIENGKYNWKFQSKEGWLFWSFPDTDPVKDFVASVEIKHTEGNPAEGYGLIFRALQGQYYLFQINEEGRFSFLIFDADKYTPIIERTSSAIKTGEANQITVQAQGSHFTFYINGEKVSEIDDDRLTSGYIGVLTSTSGTAQTGFNFNQNDSQEPYVSNYEVDNFKIWNPKSGATVLDKLTPEAGKIVFVSDKDGNSEIYTINSDGTSLKRLTNDKSDDLSPKWSPDGNQIAFVSTRDGNSEIYIMDADGTNVARITENDSEDIDPSWSPDGKSIAFVSNRDGNYEIYILNLATKDEERITENNFEDHNPSWSSTKDLILYRSMEYGSPIFYTVDIASKESTRVSPRLAPYTKSRPVFSSDGSNFVYESGTLENKTGIMIYNLNTKQSTEVVPRELTGQQINISPTWSPASKQIAFVSDRNGQNDIFIISIDGKSILQLTDDKANESELDWFGN